MYMRSMPASARARRVAGTQCAIVLTVVVPFVSAMALSGFAPVPPLVAVASATAAALLVGVPSIGNSIASALVLPLVTMSRMVKGRWYCPSGPWYI